MQVIETSVKPSISFALFAILLSLLACGGGGPSAPGSPGQPGGGGTGPPITASLSRSRYIRTDAVTEYSLWLNPHWTVYNSATSRLFVTDPIGNHVIVIDTTTQTKIASINVPGAFGIDDTSDHLTLYVGTLPGDVYTIDAVGLKVTHRYLASQIGPY